MKCPNCHDNMTSSVYESVTIDQCNGCGGVWLDDREIVAIVQDKSKTFKPNEKVLAHGEKGKDRETKSLACPKCKSTMLINQYAYGSGVFIDRCPNKHGLWLDRNELDRIQIAMDESDLRSKKPSSSPLSQAAAKNCPQDGTRMFMISYEGEQLDKCPKCKGVWCDAGELQKIVANQANLVATEHATGLHSSTLNPRPSSALELASSLNCVVCSQAMVKVNFSYSSGVIVDRCRSHHGAWLDHHELEKVQAFVELWSKKTPELRSKYSNLLEKAAIDGTSSYNKAVMDGIDLTLRNTLLGKALKKVFAK